MENPKSNNPKSGRNAKSGRTIKLSVSKTRKIEKGFRITISENRENYLSKELGKYKGIKVSYD